MRDPSRDAHGIAGAAQLDVRRGVPDGKDEALNGRSGQPMATAGVCNGQRCNCKHFAHAVSAMFESAAQSEAFPHSP